MKDTDGSWAQMQQQQLPGCVTTAHGGALLDAQSCWHGTNVGVATIVHVV